MIFFFGGGGSYIIKQLRGHCHLCDADEAKARRRQLQNDARRQRRRLAIDERVNTV